MPAVATYRFASARQLLAGYALAIASYALGPGLSAATDLPSSVVIVWVTALVAIAVHIVGGHGAPAQGRPAAGG